MRIVGIDIGKGTAVCCLLEELPSEPRQFYIDRVIYHHFEASTIDLGLTDDVRLHAQRLCNLQREEIKIEIELRQLIQNPEFFAYRKVFTKFGIGMRHQAILISQIYPFQNFLGEDGKPIVVFKRSGKNSKNTHTKRYLSRRRFEKMFGIAPTENSSGKKHSKKIIGGSSLCRKLFWQWIRTRIEPLNGRKNNPLLCPLNILYPGVLFWGKIRRMLLYRKSALTIILNTNNEG